MVLCKRLCKKRYMDLLLRLKYIKMLSLEYLHKFSNCILFVFLCSLLTYSKLPPASHQTSACTYWTQPAGGLLVVIEFGETAAGKVLTDGCVLVVARTHPRNTHIKPHPQANWRMGSVMATSISWGASQKTRPNQRVQFPFKLHREPSFSSLLVTEAGTTSMVPAGNATRVCPVQ